MEWPSIAHLADLEVEHVLVTHGAPIIGDGRAALRQMLEGDPIAHTTRELSGDAVPT